MSKEYEGQDPLDIAAQAEKDLNSNSAKQGANASDSGMSQHFHVLLPIDPDMLSPVLLRILILTLPFQLASQASTKA